MVIKEHPEVCHQSQNRSYILCLHNVHQSFPIRSPGSLTQVHLGNTMPPPCQSATMDTDKNINR